MNGYKVKFTNTETGKGWIDGYKTAAAAKGAVIAWNTLLARSGGKGIRAEYLGRPKPEVRANG